MSKLSSLSRNFYKNLSLTIRFTKHSTTKCQKYRTEQKISHRNDLSSSHALTDFLYPTSNEIKLRIFSQFASAFIDFSWSQEMYEIQLILIILMIIICSHQIRH